MTDHRTNDGNEFLIPARTLRGSRQEMVGDIDQAIVGLLALRHLIDDAAPPPDGLAGEGGARAGQRFRWPRLVTALNSVGLWKLG